ncbi:metallophosphoesterase [Shivajiella indica]|uniref:Metallophosphoesterase n=1 Tax=Shivajiella indica TaxID=872115 RepID=A0ABW5B286_9BACT
MKFRYYLLAIGLGIGIFIAANIYSNLLFAQNPPYTFYLTWEDDPTSTITIDWHSNEMEFETLKFRKKGTEAWKEFESTVLPFPFSERLVHRVGIQGLEAETAYEIKFSGLDSIYYFRTLPATLDKSSLKIAIGGDSMHRKEWLEATNRIAANYEPDFVIIGGDMAYENGLAENIQRIYDWFDAYSKTMVTSDNRILPCIVAIGNHEVVGGYYNMHEGYEQTDAYRYRLAPYFYSLFAFPGQPGYNVLDIGDYLSLIILDTEHSNPVLGEQTRWLEKTLADRKGVLHKIPIYHVPAYPSVRDYEGFTQTLVRESWPPIFESNGVRIAFENHDHAYKRTFPLKNMQIDQSGIIYVGDGAWGVEPRDIHNVVDTWYLKKAVKTRAFTILTLEGREFSLISLDGEGNVIDAFPESPLLMKKD